MRHEPRAHVMDPCSNVAETEPCSVVAHARRGEAEPTTHAAVGEVGREHVSPQRERTDTGLPIDPAAREIRP